MRPNLRNDAMRTAFNKTIPAQIDDSVVRSIWKLLRIRFIAFALLCMGWSRKISLLSVPVNPANTKNLNFDPVKMIMDRYYWYQHPFGDYACQILIKP